MKNVFIAFVLVIFATAVVYAGTAGGTAPAVGRVNVSLTVPKVANAECKSLVTGKAGTATFDVSSTTMVSWKAFTSAVDSTAVTLKRFFATATATNTAYTPGSSEKDLPIEAKAYSIVFGKFSAASNATTPVVCMDKN